MTVSVLLSWCDPPDVRVGVAIAVTHSLCLKWRTAGGGLEVWGVQTPTEIPNALQNCAKLNPNCENC